MLVDTLYRPRQIYLAIYTVKTISTTKSKVANYL